MENKSLLWKESVNKAFYGFLAFTLLSGVVGGIVSLVSGAAGIASLASGGSGAGLVMPLIVGILAIAGYVYYFLGIKGMKAASVGNVIEPGTSQIYTGALLALIGAVVDLIPLLGWVAAILSIISFVLMFLGFGKIRDLAVNSNAAAGAKQLWLAMLLGLIGAVIGFIPFIGGIISMIISIVVLVFGFLGWKNISNSELE